MTRSRTDERYASVSPREGSGKSQRLSWGMAAESYSESPSARSGASPPAWRSTHFSWNHVTCPISHIKGLTIRSWGPMSCASDRSATNSSVLKRASLTQEARIASLSTVTSPGACRKIATLHLRLLKANKILANQKAPGNSGHRRETGAPLVGLVGAVVWAAAVPYWLAAMRQRWCLLWLHFPIRELPAK